MEFFYGLLQSVALLMVSPAVPSPGDAGAWTGPDRWSTEGQALVYEARSTMIPESCAQEHDGFLVTPTTVQAGQRLFADDRLVAISGDRTFKLPSRMFSSLQVPCHELVGAKVVRWDVFTATPSIAKVHNFPVVREGPGMALFFESTVNIIASGAMLILGVICFLIFRRKVSNAILTTLLFTCLSFSINFAGNDPNVFFFAGWEPLHLQKVIDGSLWTGLIFACRLLCLLKFCSSRMFRVALVSCLVGMSLILVARNFDQIQVGSNIAFIGVNLTMLSIVGRSLLFSLRGQDREGNLLLQVSAAAIFCITGFNDTLLVQVGIDSVPLFPIGVLANVALLALAVNDLIVQTYVERDYLRENLEKEVALKTEELRNK
jgi:hypothetical protein